MNYLAIDTSGDLIVVAKKDDKKEVRFLKGCNTKHSLTLMPYIEEVLIALNLEKKDLDFIAAVTGPGSFTGIRIGVATVKALCFALNKPCLSLTSFDLLAYADNAPDKNICLIDANHGNYYCAQYENYNLIMKPCFLTADQIKEKLGNNTISMSKQNENFENVFESDLVSGLINAVEHKKNELIDSEELVPLYVKRSQAEEEFCS